MDLGLKDRSVLVAAGTRGIGLACARLFRQEGARVAVCGRTEADLARAREEHGCVAVRADVSTSEGVATFVEQAVRAQGSVDTLVVNAGGPPSLPFEEVGEEAWRAAFDLTLMSAVRLSRAVLPAMRERGAGRIVFITSLSVKQPLPRMVLSNSLRAGVTALCKTLVMEAASDGITANCVAPGYTATERLGQLFEVQAAAKKVRVEDIRAEVTSSIPAGRLAEPEEVARAVVYLGAPVSGYINGQTVVVDGGWTRGLV